MVAVNKFVRYSTIAILFSEAFYVTYGIEIKLFYFVVLLNLLLVLLSWDFKIDRGLLLALAYVWAAGFASAMVGPNRMSSYLQQAIGISVCASFFYLFFRSQDLSLVRMFRVYSLAALWLSGLGLALAAVQTIYRGQFVPVQSIFREPAHFGTVVIPAFYYFVSNAFRGRGDRLPAAVMAAALIFSASATAYIGVLVSVILLLRTRWYTLVAAPLILIALAGAMYFGNQRFRVRVDSTGMAVLRGNVSGAVLSTYALLSNGYVTGRALQERPLLGYGPGGHEYAHDRYIGSLPGSAAFAPYFSINRKDANSLLLRAGSEFGLVGVLAILWFLVHYRVGGPFLLADINAAVLVYFVLKLLREGHWFSPEMYFFLWMYVLTYRSARRSTAEPESGLNVAPAPSQILA